MTSVQTILHPTAFSLCADKAFQAACSVARDRGAQLIVLHVMEPVRLSGQWPSSPRPQLLAGRTMKGLRLPDPPWTVPAYEDRNAEFEG